MSGRGVPSVSETSGRNGQPVQTYQSSWMSHWTRPSFKATAGTLNIASCVSGSEELGCGFKADNLRRGLDLSMSSKGPGVIETRTSEMIKDSTNIGTEKLGFGGFNLGRKTDDMQVQRAALARNFERGKDVEINRGTQFLSMLRGFPCASDTSSRRLRTPDEGTSKNPLEWMKSRSSAEESCLVALKPLQETLAEPSPVDVLYKHDLRKYELHQGKSENSSLIGGDDIVYENQFQNTQRRLQEHISCNKHSVDLLFQGNNDRLPQSKNFMNECFRESNASLLLDVPSTTGNRLPIFNQEWFQKMQKCSGFRPFPDHFIVSEETEAKESFYNCYSLNKLPNYLHNVETMRICTTMEEGDLKGFPGFSQTTRSLVITKTTDFNLSNEFDILNSTGVITKVNGNLTGQGKQGVILQPLSSSTESERQGYVGDFKTRKATINNESSAETDNMDMDNFKGKNPYSGVNSSPSHKAFDMNSHLSYPVGVFSSRGTESRDPKTELQDINLEIPLLPAAAASSDNSGPSCSKTQSLEMDMLMAHAEPSKPNFNQSLEDSREADPGNRWGKRLKLSPSQFSSQGTKSPDLAENSHEKRMMKKYFGRILTSGIPGSEPCWRKHHGKESVALDNKGTLSKQITEITVSPRKKNTESLFSQPWIQRWRYSESHSSRDYTDIMAVGAPQSSKLAMEDHLKEQFPSIGAMALMGKAMRGFQPCNLQKRGSVTVWNTKTI